MLAALLPALMFAVRHANNSHAVVLSTLNTLLCGRTSVLRDVLTDELAIPLGLYIDWPEPSSGRERNVMALGLERTCQRNERIEVSQRGNSRELDSHVAASIRISRANAEDSFCKAMDYWIAVKGAPQAVGCSGCWAACG